MNIVPSRSSSTESNVPSDPITSNTVEPDDSTVNPPDPDILEESAVTLFKLLSN